MTPEFSIIIPVYNAEKYLAEALESAINQSYSNIEIICINDGSKDESYKILAEYAQKDNRIVVINEDKNAGTSKARKDGVLASKGNYILFLDADDTISLTTCEVLTQFLGKADIIHFGVNVNLCNGMRLSSIKGMEKYLVPCTEKIDMPKMRELCFQKRLLSHNLWAKCFKGTVCRKAFAYLSNERLIMAEDMYAFFAVSVLSDSYLGVLEKLYNYNYGRGVTGEDKDYFQSFEVYCTQAKTVQACYTLIKQLNCEKEYADVLRNIKNNALNSCMKYLYKNDEQMNENIMECVQKIFVQYWSSEDLALGLVNLCQKYQEIDKKKWIFPFEKVKKDATVVIYGAGDMGQDYYKQLKDSQYCKIVAMVDKNYGKYTYLGYDVMPPEKLLELEYDYIVLAISKSEIRTVVKQYLLSINCPGQVVESD